ncbi:hypothetical protein CHS0354_007994 [Potamilus streckersoni]|uniref:Uncharacterized protein n=1 Tax=Potamilus streckersoni TaxID=2493646 RepID=A0AAE0SCZ8_9BIVA|nr:hypothetical protein CHS0354_007994 [Potamilus streckersoni]
MNQRSITTTIILVLTTVTLGQDNYEVQSVLPQHPVPSRNIDIHGSPLGIWKPGGDLPLHGGTKKSDIIDPLLSNPLGSLDLSALGSRETRLRQWLADNSLSFDSLRAEFHPDPHHARPHVNPPVHPSKPNVHETVDPTLPHGRKPVIDPWLDGGNDGAKVLPASSDLLSGFNNRFLGANSDPLVHQGLFDTFSGIGQVFNTPNVPKSIVKNPVVKEVPLGNSHDGIRDPHVVSPVQVSDHGATNLHPLGLNVPKVSDPILGVGHGAAKVDNLVVPGANVGGLVHDPRRKPIGGFPTGY